MAGRLTKVGKAFYLFTMPGHPFPDSPVLTNSARSYLRRADFLMDLSVAIVISTAILPAYSTQYRGILPFVSVTCRCADSAVYPLRTSRRLSLRIGK
jgi:hypothetical protein